MAIFHISQIAVGNSAGGKRRARNLCVSHKSESQRC
jgi:hypothetical protein